MADRLGRDVDAAKDRVGGGSGGGAPAADPRTWTIYVCPVWVRQTFEIAKAACESYERTLGKQDGC